MIYRYQCNIPRTPMCTMSGYLSIIINSWISHLHLKLCHGIIHFTWHYSLHVQSPLVEIASDSRNMFTTSTTARKILLQLLIALISPNHHANCHQKKIQASCCYFLRKNKQKEAQVYKKKSTFSQKKAFSMHLTKYFTPKICF